MRRLLVDPYHVVEIFRKLGLSFEDIAALGFYLEDEPERRLTAIQLKVWFEEESRLRAPTSGVGPDGTPEAKG